MRTKFFLLAILFFNIFSAFNVYCADLEKDQQIISLLTSNKFNNTLIFYPDDEGNEHPIRIIYNPKEEMLWGSFLYYPTKSTIIMIADLSIPLARHFEDLVLEQRGSFEGAEFLLKNETAEEGWDTIRPVHIAENIVDSINDEIIQNVFNSVDFVNQVIYYQLNDEYYQVRLLHNPEEKTFSAKKNFSLIAGGPVYSFKFSWNKRYGMMLDKRAPKELIDHLSACLSHLSYYDWYFNFSLENGTYFEYVRTTGNITDSYSLDTFFEFTDSF
ncbi:MAG: hypothetical protein H0V82_00835 [Candidatus Protochlamydia sp.]|nr:hypothetical protein [Candidatus Protochlamydia sp.]